LLQSSFCRMGKSEEWVLAGIESFVAW